MALSRIVRFASIVLIGAGGEMAAGQEPSPDHVFDSYLRYTEASALLEKTIFKLDVALLTLRLGPETTSELEGLLRARGSQAMSEDELVELAVHTRNSSARLRFLRGIGFERFLDGIRDSLEAARRAGWVDQAFERTLSDGFPIWYSPLRDRGVKEGDAMFYFIRGDTLRTVFRTRDGRNVVDHVDVSSMAVLSVMGGFLAPESDFRDGLLDTLSQAISPDPGEPRGGRGPLTPRDGRGVLPTVSRPRTFR